MQHVQQVNNHGVSNHFPMCNEELMLHFGKRSFGQCLCGLWHVLHFKGGYRGVLTEKEVLERAFRALDELAGKRVAEKFPRGVPPLEQWPESLRDLADERAAASGEPETVRREVWLSWVEWKAAALNRLFQEQGVTGELGRITPATVRHGERKTGYAR